MKAYTIFINSDEHPRTINTPANGRTYYSKLTVYGIDELTAKVAELRNAGKVVNDIRTDLGTRIWM